MIILSLFTEIEIEQNNNNYCFSLYTQSDLNFCGRKLFKVDI